MKKSCNCLAIPILLLVLNISHLVTAQTVVPIVPVGKGSYGNGTPFDLARNTWGDDGNWKVYNQMMAMHNLWPAKWKVAAADTNSRGLPTNDEWVSMLFQENGSFGGTVWNHPTAIQLKNTGSTVWFPNAWSADGSSMEMGWPIQIEPAGATLNASKCTVKNWTDWTTVAELTDGTNKMDVTFGHGFPFVWFEPNFNPTIQIGDAPYTTDGVTPIATWPFVGDHFVGVAQGKMFAVFMPPNTTVTKTNNNFKLTFSGTSRYFVVGLLKNATDLATLQSYAYVKPVDTQVKWTYNQAAATMNVNWTIKSVNLTGAPNTDIIQGFIPHHYQRTLSSPAFIDLSYLTAKGTMKCAVGKSFDFSYRFTGILPNVPAPKRNAIDKFPFDSTYLAGTITAASSRTAIGTDIYWGLKPLLTQSRYALMASLTAHPKAGALKTKVKEAFKDWLTYTPGETAHAFYKYDEKSNLGALVGFDPGGYSATFTDHDMCYGYMVNAAAHYSMTDPAFLGEYGGMLRMMAKHINNWERTDKSIPFMRLMDPWNGHSWAGGTSGADVESMSECMQMAAGTFLVGEMMGDQGMRDAGAFVYASMSRAYDQYVRDVDKINFAPSFALPIAAKLNNNGPALGNYVGQEALYWINWIPYSTPMNFFFSDTAVAREKYNRFMASYGANINNWGADFYNNLTQYINGFDHPKAMQMWHDYNTKYQGDDLNGITYYYLQAASSLGSIDWTRWTSSPLSQVYYNSSTNKYTYVAYNPTATEQTVTAYNNGTVVGTFKVPAYTTVSTQLDAILTKLKIYGNGDVVKPSETMQLTTLGLDQYGGTVTLASPVTWSIIYGTGSVDNSGIYTATADLADSILIQAESGSLKATYQLKVNDLRRPFKIAISPAYKKIPQNSAIYYDAVVYDQYGGLLANNGLVWTTSGGGSISQSGSYISNGTVGTFTNKVTLGNLSFDAVAVVDTPLDTFTNIALNKPSFTDQFVSANTAAKANDGDISSRWETKGKADDNNSQHWWYVNLNNVYNVSEVQVYWDGAAAAVYAIQASMNGTAWTTVDSMSTGTWGHTGVFDLSATTVTAQYLRVWCYTRATDYGFSIKEFRAYGSLYDTPKPLNKIVLNPAGIDLKIGQTVTYTASGYNADGVNVPTPGSWKASGGGTINSSGIFEAQSSGTFTVSYTSGSIVGTATVIVAENSAKQMISFGFANPDSRGVINGNNILIEIPADINKTNLIATFTNSASSTVKVGGVTQTSGVTANDFTNPVIYTVVAQDGTTFSYTVILAGTTGIDKAEARSLKIFPNPAFGLLSIETESLIDHILVSNMLGQEVSTYHDINASSVSIDLSSQPKGVYFIKISCGEKILIRKVMIE